MDDNKNPNVVVEPFITSNRFARENILSAKHSPLYEKYKKPARINRDGAEYDAFTLDFDRIACATPPLELSELTDLLMEVNDAQSGIVSTFNKEKNEWLRDATAMSPAESLLGNSLYTDSHNMLLRCISRLRGAHYAVDNCQTVDAARKTKIRDHLDYSLRQLLHKTAVILKEENPRYSQLNKLETKCNNTILSSLHRAKLTEGCRSKKQAESLLFAIRNAAGVIDPTRKFTTLSYDRQNRVVTEQTQEFITEKTEDQKKSFLDRKNALQAQGKRTGLEEIELIFSDRFSDDATCGGAQCRKTKKIGLNNASFETTTRTSLTPPSAPNSADTTPQFTPYERFKHLSPKERVQGAYKTETLVYGRFASPVFVGKCHDDTERDRYTRQNFEQAQQATLHRYGTESFTYVGLYTDAPFNKENLIHESVNRFIKSQPNSAPIHYELHSLNALGTLQRQYFGGAFQDKTRDPFDRIKRSKETVERIITLRREAFVALKPGTDKPEGPKPEGPKPDQAIVFAGCASNQDRAGCCFLLKAVQEADDFLAECGRQNVDKDELLGAVVASGHQQALASFLCPGSPGLKTDSEPQNNIFGKTLFGRFTPLIFSKTANTNKKNTIDRNLFLALDPDLYNALEQQVFRNLTLVKQFRDKQQRGGFADSDNKASGLDDTIRQLFEKASEQSPSVPSDLSDPAQREFAQQHKVIIALLKKEPVTKKTIRALTQTYQCLADLGEAVEAKNADTIFTNTEQLLRNTQQLPGSRSNTKLLLGFAFVALACIAAVCAIFAPISGVGLGVCSGLVALSMFEQSRSTSLTKAVETLSKNCSSKPR